ncbi:MAG TPA: adenylosuccinate synthetase [Candidatus Paceibacterota bacterium]
MNSIERLVKNHRTIAVVCNQWGDSGKGKIVDYLAEWAVVIARGTGGANAGHTIWIKDKQFIFHLIPSGILYDSAGKVNVVGNGTVIDPCVFCDELSILNKESVSFNHLKIALNAKLVLPHHVLMDLVQEQEKAQGSGKLGTTGRGIGPAYVDHYARTGLVIGDLLNKDLLRKKLVSNHESKKHFFRYLLQQQEWIDIPKIMGSERLGSGMFYDNVTVIDLDAVIEKYTRCGEVIKEMIVDTDTLMRKALGRNNILLEGAQGNLLSIDFGSYPYVTSSDCSVEGLAKGVGLTSRAVDLTLGLVKACYMTRVGSGPFPTEMGGDESAEWCDSGIRQAEEKKAAVDAIASINDEREFWQGVRVRMEGDEYGATTGRPRRTGWLDLPLLRYSRMMSGDDIVITKLDVLDACKTIKLCTEYEYTGPTLRLGERMLHAGDRLRTAIPCAEVLSHCRPIYVECEGWQSDITKARVWDDLPHLCQKILRQIEKESETTIRVVSVGREREATIVL